MIDKKTSAILLIMVLGLNAGAFPQIPEYYQGTVTVDGSSPPTGTEVKATSASGDTFTTNTLDASGTYAINILIDDPNSTADEGATNGESLTWYVNGIAASTPASDTASSGNVNTGFSISSSSPVTTTTTTTITVTTTTTVPATTTTTVSTVVTTTTVSTVVTTTTVSGGGSSSDALTKVQEKICHVLQLIYELLVYIAAGIAAVMIVVMGIAWITSAENSRTRTAAKEAVIHVIVGLIVVSLAVVLVEMVLPEGASCVAGWDD